MALKLHRIVSLSLSTLLLLGLIRNFTPQMETFSSPKDRSIESAADVDLNVLMFEEFQKWDALITRYMSTNGTLTDIYDRSQAPNYDKKLLVVLLVTCLLLMLFTQALETSITLENSKASWTSS